MNEMSSYPPPLPQPPSSIALPPNIPPAVSVFGILHLVFAGLGVVGGAWGLFMVVAGNPFLKMGRSNPQLNAQFEAQIAMQAKISPVTITSSILSLVVAIPMIIAGIQLVKKRKHGLKWSNAYVWSSLGAKFVNLVLAATILVPAMTEMTRGMMANSHVPDSFSNIMAGAMAGGAIGGVLISCIYPITTLVLLNRPLTRAWFAGLAK